MKVKYLALLILIIYGESELRAQTQEISASIIYDFASKTVAYQGDINDLNKGDFYQIKINNINLNKWKISLNSKDTILTKELATPSFGDISLDGISDILASLTSKTSSDLSLPKTKVFLFDPNQPADDEIKDRFNMERKSLSAYYTSIEDIDGEIDALKIEVYKKRLSAFDDNGSIKQDFDFDMALKEIIEIRGDIMSLKDAVEKGKSEYEKFSADETVKINSDAEFIKTDKEIKKLYASYVKSLTELKGIVDSENSLKLLESLLFIRDKNEGYTSLPMQYKGDTKINLKIIPRDDKYNLESTYAIPLVFPIEQKSYWSVGLSFYGSNLHDEQYSSISTPLTDTTKVYSLIQEKEQKYEIGMATLMRFGKSFRKNSKWGYHGNFGVGISLTEKIKPRVLFGGGLAYGKRHGLALDIGGIVGYVDRLSSAYDLEKEYAEKPENVTVSILDIGVYFSIGYLYRF